MPYVNVWVEPEDTLEDATTEDLQKELARRLKKGDKDAAEPDWHDWDRLADFIAEGRTKEALDLLAWLSPAEIDPRTVTFFAHLRAQARAA